MAATQTALPPGQVRGLATRAAELIPLSPGLIAFNFAYLGLAWALMLGAIAVFWAVPAWYTFVAAFLVVSSRQQALLNCQHECGHGKFVSSRKWNAFVGRWFCAAPVGSPYESARHRHLTHHRLLATADDPDRDLHAGARTKTRAGMARHFIGGMLGGYAGMVLMGPPPRDGAGAGSGSARRDLVSLVVAQGALAAGFTLAFAWWIYPALWLAPLATLTVLSHLTRSFVEHAISEYEEEAHSNRLITITSNRVERFFVAPYSMNYHAEHHLVPSVPAPRLRRLHHELAARDDLPPLLVRPSYSQALRAYVRALR